MEKLTLRREEYEIIQNRGWYHNQGTLIGAYERGGKKGVLYRNRNGMGCIWAHRFVVLQRVQ